MVTFVPNSTFGRKTLRRVFESEATLVSAWLLNVPSDTVGDRSTWTWSDNWKNYRVESPFAYTTNTSVINLNSQSAVPPSEIELFEDGVNVSPGAYYVEGSGADNNNQYTYVYNTGTQTITFTHYAVFVQEQSFSSLTYYATDVTSPRTNNYLAIVKPYDTTNEDPVTLGPGQAMFLYFNFFAPTFVGASSSNFDSYSALVAADEAYINDLIDETNLYSPPNPIGNAGSNSYSLNKSTSPFLLQTYKNLLGFTPSTIAAPRFLVELLNVTGSEPAFDEPWSAWSTSSINRFAVASPEYEYGYNQETGMYTVSLGPFTFEVSFASDKIKLQQNVEFLVTPPSSSSFTYTHLAIFLQPDATLPVNGQPYTHTDPDTFVGVIRLAASVTMTSTSTARAYPFNLGMVYNPEVTAEQI
jgi:hypothetical protein